MTITKQSINRMKTCLPVCNILFYPLDDSRLCIQVVHWDVKETLKTWIYTDLMQGEKSQLRMRSERKACQNSFYFTNCDHQHHHCHGSPCHLDLAGMEIHGDDVVGTGHGEHVGNLVKNNWSRKKRLDKIKMNVGHQLRADWGSALVLLVLPGIRNHLI